MRSIRSTYWFLVLRDPVLLLLCGGGFVLDFIAYAVVQIFLLRQPHLPQYALHATAYFGIDLLGPAWKLFLPAMLGSFFLLVNVVASVIVYRKEAFISYAIAGLTALMELLLVVGTVSILLLNTYV